MLARVEYSSVPEQLETSSVRVVHHEESNPIGGAEVTCTNKLAIALQIRKPDQVRSQHLYEPGGTSAVLNVGPPCLADGRHVKAVARGDESCFVRGERIRLGCALHGLMPPEVFVLGLLHRGCKHKLHIFAGHIVYLSEFALCNALLNFSMVTRFSLSSNVSNCI